MAPLCCLVNVIGRSCVVSSSSEIKAKNGILVKNKYSIAQWHHVTEKVPNSWTLKFPFTIHMMTFQTLFLRKMCSSQTSVVVEVVCDSWVTILQSFYPNES